MNNFEKKKKLYIIYAAVGVIPVFYLSLLLAVGLEETGNLFRAIGYIRENPTELRIVDSTLKVIGFCLMIYIFAVIYFISEMKNYRNGEEHGSAKWGNTFKINKKYTKHFKKQECKILTQNVCMGTDDRKHRRNLNAIVTGGSGAMKTRGVVQPNLLQGNTSYVILDPKGENLRDTANFLIMKGYKIRVLNFKSLSESDCYNPFAYLESDDDVQRLATIILKATTPKNSYSNDPYWDQQCEMLLKALMFFLYHEVVAEEQNFPTLMDMLREAVVIDGKEQEKSIIDELFDELEDRNPDHIALKYYKDYRNVPAKTLNTIQSVLKGKLEKFNLDSLRSITSTDDLDLLSLGKIKTALFLVTPDDDTSYNFIISMLYLQLFQQLERYADSLPEQRLPIHVQFLMDEFNNVALPDGFENTISVARSRGFSFTIILQNLTQIKAKFEKEWESIVGNCDTFLYLGGNEQSTHKYVSELLGKETIDTNTFGKTSGRSGSYSKNYQKAGRELLTPDEVRMLENEYALLFIRGSRPVIDKKYNVWEHPNAKYSTIGGGEPYVFGNNVVVGYSIEPEFCGNDEIMNLPYENIIDLDELSEAIDKKVQEIKDKNYL